MQGSDNAKGTNSVGRVVPSDSGATRKATSEMFPKGSAVGIASTS